MAAFIDGEGCIRAKARTGRAAFPYLHVTNTDARLMNWLLDTFGGTVSTHRPANGRYRTRYDWQAKQSSLREILTQCLPFLLLKREQAEVALALLSFVRYRGHVRVRTDETRQREDLKAQLHVLNAKGPKIA